MQLPQTAVQILLRGLVALARCLKCCECISQSFLESGHVRDGLLRAGQRSAGLLVLQLLDLQAVALGLGPPGAASTYGKGRNGGGQVS
ncbi:hypothetical protein [Delftia acidovorans]|uniref:hypothetical protein n=1 Tax=Delftia acidovorans TaxID=80866 RepID=UPI0018E84370|nr:hypothetical protein [Delftia acidovorans]